MGRVRRSAAVRPEVRLRPVRFWGWARMSASSGAGMVVPAQGVTATGWRVAKVFLVDRSIGGGGEPGDNTARAISFGWVACCLYLGYEWAVLLRGTGLLLWRVVSGVLLQLISCPWTNRVENPLAPHRRRCYTPTVSYLKIG